MQAGTLKDFIAIEMAVDTANPNNGEQLRTWQQIWRGRAKVDFSSGTQSVINGDPYRILSKDVRSRDQATIFTCELLNE